MISFLTHFLKLALTLWLTASLVFLVSRSVPSANQPKGMAEADLAVYGLADATTQEKVKEGYRKRAGLDLPSFYLGFSLFGSRKVPEVQATKEDLPWVKHLIIRHGLKASKSFYGVWQAWVQTAPQKDKDQMRSYLQELAESSQTKEKDRLYSRISNYLSNLNPTTSRELLKMWGLLQSSKAPVYYLFPVLHWNGPQNAYHLWMNDLSLGHMGISYLDYQPVSEKLSDALLISCGLAMLGLLVAVLLSYFMGMYFAMNTSSVFTKVAHLLLYILDSIPGFLIALTLFGVSLLIASLTGQEVNSFQPGFPSVWHLWNQPHILLGSLCVSLFILPHLTLQFYRSLDAQNNKLYLRTALAKGLSPKEALLKHAFPNALVSTLTVLSEVIISLMAGVLIIEITFSLPGIGSLLTSSILKGDYPVLIGITLFFLTFRVLIVWATELTLAFLDPRLRTK